MGTLGAAALSLLLGLFFSSTLTRPLKDLINATRDVAQGNLEREVPVRSKDELGDLTKSFNQNEFAIETKPRPSPKHDR